MKTEGYFHGIRARFIGWTVLLTMCISLLASALFYLSLRLVVRDIGADFATQYTLREKGRILAPLEREVALCETLAKTPAITDWAADENNPILKAAALRELECFRQAFRDKTVFLGIQKSGHYYRREDSPPVKGDEPASTMSPDTPADAWFYATLKNIDRFNLNVDRNVMDNQAKVWINTIVHHGSERIAVAGTGMELDSFIKQLIHSQNKAVTPILVDASGAIQAHSNTNLIDHNTLAKRAEDRSTIFRLMPNERDRADLQKALVSLKASPDSVSTFSIVIDNQRRLVSVAYLPAIDWYLVSLIDLS